MLDLRKPFTLLFHPVKAVEEILGQEISFKEPSLIIFVIGLFGGLSGYVVVQNISRFFEPRIRVFMAVGGYLAILSGIVTSFLVWIGFTVVLHLLALAFKGRNGLKRFLQLVGLSFTPQIISSFLGFLFVCFYFPELSVTVPINFTSIRLIQENLQRTGVFVYSRVIGRLMFFWSLVLCGICVKKNYGVSNKRAAAIVLIPTLLYFAITFLLF